MKNEPSVGWSSSGMLFLSWSWNWRTVRVKAKEREEFAFPDGRKGTCKVLLWVEHKLQAEKGGQCDGLSQTKEECGMCIHLLGMP